MKKLMSRIHILLVALLSLAIWSCESPQATTGSCSGTIINSQTGAPISGAGVKLTPHSTLVCVTDARGFYYFDEVEEGLQTISVTANGFNSTTRNIVIDAGINNTFDINLTPINSGNGDDSGDDGGSGTGSGSGSGNDNYDNPNDQPGGTTTEDYSEAQISTQLDNLDVQLISCKRSGNTVVLKYTLTNTYAYANMGITVQNVNSFTQKTHISDDMGNQYPKEFVKISLAGSTLGWGNNIEGTLLPNVPSQCIITVQNVDTDVKYMHYYIYTSIAFPGGVNTSADVILSNVKVH
jgi:hypothetical protein